jgi:hypothetical protein
MISGFYSVQFTLPDESQTAGGVMVFINGRLYGGDSSYSYLGTYRADRRNLEVWFRIKLFNGFSESTFSAFEDTRDEIRLSGPFNESGFSIRGQLLGIENELLIEGKWITKVSAPTGEASRQLPYIPCG